LARAHHPAAAALAWGLLRADSSRSLWTSCRKATAGWFPFCPRQRTNWCAAANRRYVPKAAVSSRSN